MTNKFKMLAALIGAPLMLLAASPALAALQNGGVYEIIAAHSGKCIDVSQVSTRTGQPLHQWTCLGRQQRNQLFQAIAMGNGYFELRAMHSGKCMDVSQVSQQNGAVIHQWPCLGLGQRNQLFRPVYMGNGLYQLRAGHSNKCVDVSGVSRANGAAIIQYQCFGARKWNQLFRFVRMDRRHHNNTAMIRPFRDSDYNRIEIGGAAWLARGRRTYVYMPFLPGGRRIAYAVINGRVMRFRVSGLGPNQNCGVMRLWSRNNRVSLSTRRERGRLTLFVRVEDMVSRVPGLVCRAGD